MKTVMKAASVAGLVAVIVFTAALPAYAATNHANPDTAEQIFSGISLLRYYSASLDFVLQRNPTKTATYLEKMPFANVTAPLKEVTAAFAQHTVTVSNSVSGIYKLWNAQRTLAQQGRVNEAGTLAGVITDSIAEARDEISSLEQSVMATDLELHTPEAPANSALRLTDNQIWDKISRIRYMLNLVEAGLRESSAGAPARPGPTLEDLLKSGKLEQLLGPEKFAELQDLLKSGTLEDLLKSGKLEQLLGPEKFAELQESGKLAVIEPTSLTLGLDPVLAFVGDEVRFSGMLTGGNLPLPGRDVDILLESTVATTVTTDAAGRYQGKLTVPYWYIPEIEMQAYYHPEGKDAGLYFLSLSQPVTLQVLFYDATLEVKVDGEAYPGLEATFSGRFDYGQSPTPDQREVGIYVDDVYLSDIVVADTFTGKLVIDPAMPPGKHVLTLSAPADRRYAPVDASCLLNVTRAAPVLNMITPGMALIPGDIGLGGSLSSVAGPLQGAAVKIELGDAQTQVTTAGDGSFSGKLRVGLGLSFIGLQTVSVQVLPVEPWNAPLAATRSIFMVNAVCCGAALIILVLLGFYLPRRLMKRLGASPRKQARPGRVVVPRPVPVYSVRKPAPAPPREISGQAGGEPRSRIYFWYRAMVRLIVKLFHAVFRPQQTLREFARESGPSLGPAARYFMELTLLVEKALYGPREPLSQDAEKSQRLSRSIKQEISGEDI